MIYKGVALWNYVRDDEKQLLYLAHRFYGLGFQSVSYNGREFSLLSEQGGRELAAFLNDTGMKLTVHYLLPDPDAPDKCQAFLNGIDHMSYWQQQYGLLNGLTFDVRYEKSRLMPYLNYTLNVMRLSGVRIAMEDYPLSQGECSLPESIVHPLDDFGLLIDIGHMNLRQTKSGSHEAADFLNAFRALPYPIHEVHVHDNLGEKDDHRWLGFGTLPLNAVARGLHEAGFSGIATVEIVQRDWPLEDGIRYAKDTAEKFMDAMTRASEA